MLIRVQYANKSSVSPLKSTTSWTSKRARNRIGALESTEARTRVGIGVAFKSGHRDYRSGEGGVVEVNHEPKAALKARSAV